MEKSTIQAAILLVGEHALHSGEFTSLPRIGEKIVINGTGDKFPDSFAKIYEVIDIHRNLDNHADVFVKDLGLEIQYTKRLIHEHQSPKIVEAERKKLERELAEMQAETREMTQNLRLFQFEFSNEVQNAIDEVNVRQKCSHCGGEGSGVIYDKATLVFDYVGCCEASKRDVEERLNERLRPIMLQLSAKYLEPIIN